MVNCSELRIGNLFHPMTDGGESYYEGLILTVVAILPEKVECSKDLITMFYRNEEEKPIKGYKGRFVGYDFLHPIPLTEEWLLMFGFEIENLVVWWKDQLAINPSKNIRLVGTLKNNSIEIFGQALKRRIFLRSVHQLQNWFYFNTEGQELQLSHT